MTRRAFCSTIPAVAVAASRKPPLAVPVRILQDGKRLAQAELRYFWWRLWPQTVRNFGACGIRLEHTVKTVEVERPSFRQPVVPGIDARAVNFVVTNQLPAEWDRGRALSGVTTAYRGCHLCMIAVRHAHPHQVPFLSLNTCVHELLHVLLHDVFAPRPAGVTGQARELLVDWYATRLWLFGDGAAIRKSAEGYVEKLRKQVQITGRTDPPG